MIDSQHNKYAPGKKIVTIIVSIPINPVPGTPITAIAPRMILKETSILKRVRDFLSPKMTAFERK